MSKKKILTIALCAALIAALVVGASIAYFTDTDTATNVFTAGNIDIELNEWGTNERGTFIDFSETTALKTLAPGSSTTTVVYKVATITNTGDDAAWVWAEILIPSKLVSPYAESNETNSALHYNSYGAFDPRYINGTGSYKNTPINDGIMNDAREFLLDGDYVTEELANTWSCPSRMENTETIDGVEYVKFLTKMQSALPAGKTSLPFLRGVYMDDNVDVARNDDGSVKKNADGEVVYKIPIQTADDSTSFEYEEYDGSWELIVRVYGIQVPGFDTVDAAYAAFPRG